MTAIPGEQGRNMPLLANIGKVAVAALLIVGAIAMGASIGETPIPVETVIHTVANQVFGANYPLSAIDQGIIWNYRLTRAIVAVCCGAALAVSGLVLQSLLRNALADPYILGISAGASTGAVSITILGLGAGVLSLSTGAFIGAIMAFVFVAILARAAGGGVSAQGTGQIILAGIAGSQLFNALTSFIVTRSANSEQVRGIMFWLLGNLSGVRWDDVRMAVPVALAGVLVCLWYRRALDAFTFGSDSAASLGIPVRRVQIVLIGTVAVMTAVMVSMVGSIGFVGLVIPHAARFLVGVRHSRLLPVTALMGAVFLVVADIISRTIIPGQVLPIGVITALVGAPGFAVILIRGRRIR
jgi:iron complex transport system permease protein